jgi:hypothetical protein
MDRWASSWRSGCSIFLRRTVDDLSYLNLAGKEKWPMTASVTFFSWMFYWSLFEKMLNVPFPEGLLIELIKGGQ